MAYTLLQLRQALAEEAFSGEFPIRLATTAAGSASALTFGALAFGASGATANQYHGCWLYNTATSGTDSGTANAAVTTTNTSLTDTREAWTPNQWYGAVVTCNGKTMTVTSNTVDTLFGTAWSAGGNPGNGFAWSLSLSSPVAPLSSRVLQQAGLAPATGVLTVAPQFGSVPGLATEIIFCYDLHPDELHLAINRILRNLIHYAYLPVTLALDGDMEDSGITNWPAQGGAAVTKESTANPFLFGRQFLTVTNATVGTGVGSNSIPVIASESLLVSLPLRIQSGTNVAVSLRDALGGTDIKTVTVTNEDLPVTVQFTADVPAGVEIVTVRAMALGGTTTYDIGPVTVLSQSRKRYALDSGSIERSADIKDLFKIPQGQSAVASDSFYSFSDFNPDVDFLVEEDVRAGSPMNIVLPTFPTQPYFMRVQKRFPELAVTAALINAATNTTNADRDTVVQGAMHYIERARYARVVSSNPQLAAVHLGRSREYAQKFARMRQAQGYGIVVREIPQTRTTVAMS